MATVTPNWTDDVVVIASALLSRGDDGIARATLDLRAKFGAFLHLRVGRTTAVALGTGVSIRVNRKSLNGVVVHPASVFSQIGQTAAAAITTINGGTLGDRELLVSDTTGFVAGDYVSLGGAGDFEVARVARVLSGTELRLDTEPQSLHIYGSLANKADVPAPVQVAGGSVIEVIFDYSAAASGDDVIVECRAQRYDSDTVT
jgi:hypothetical protein